MTTTAPAPGTAPHQGIATHLLVHRPGATVVATDTGLFVRSVLGQKTLDGHDLGRAWPHLRHALETGIPVPRLPQPVTDALIHAGAVLELPAALARSQVRWHRYAMSWATDPTTAITRIAATTFHATAGALEASVLHRTATLWSLPLTIEQHPAAGVEITHRPTTARTGEPATVHVHADHPDAHHPLLWACDGHQHPTDAPTIARTPLPTRALAAGTALLASLAAASGDPTWPWATLPIQINGATHTLTDPEGGHTR